VRVDFLSGWCFERFYENKMKVCKEKNDMGWMIENWKMYKERWKEKYGVKLKNEGRMCRWWWW
jgi:hypothetical protein